LRRSGRSNEIFGAGPAGARRIAAGGTDADGTDVDGTDVDGPDAGAGAPSEDAAEPRRSGRSNEMRPEVPAEPTCSVAAGGTTGAALGRRRRRRYGRSVRRGANRGSVITAQTVSP